MRVDKFLNAVNIAKSRTIASDMLKSNVVFINGVVAKPSKEILVDDTIKIVYLKGEKSWQVLEIPATKTTPKSKQDMYIKERA